jgi:hypothetical protein
MAYCHNYYGPIPTEHEVLRDVCARFRSATATGMIKVSHCEDAYVRTQMKEPISYDYAMDLKAIQ